MSDKVREGFEAWHRSVVVGDPPHDKYGNGDYINQHVQRYWVGWRESRTVAVVDWPDQHTYTAPDVAGAAILDCRTAFGEAGFQTPETASAFRALLAERNALAFLLKRFVDGEHDQTERHMYHDEAQSLLVYLGGELQGHTLVADEAMQKLNAENARLQTLAQTEIDNASDSAKEVVGARMTLHSMQRDRDAQRKDAELFRWLASQCGEEFEVDVTGIKADGEDARWALGYEGETDLRQAVRAAMIEDCQVATLSKDKENVSRHKRR